VHEPAGDIDITAVVDSLTTLDPNRPLREADSCTAANDHLVGAAKQRLRRGNAERLDSLAVYDRRD